jgi:hypothetical protein
VLSQASPPNSPAATLPTCAGPSRPARSATLMEFRAPPTPQTQAATYTGLTSPGCAALSAFLRLSAPYSASRRAGLVSCRLRSWGSSSRGFPSPWPAWPSDHTAPLDVLGPPPRHPKMPRPRSSPPVRRRVAAPPSGVRVPPGVRSSGQGGLAS